MLQDTLTDFSKFSSQNTTFFRNYPGCFDNTCLIVFDEVVGFCQKVLLKLTVPFYTILKNAGYFSTFMKSQ